MLDVEKMIQEKYPKLRNNKIIKSAISKFSDSVIHQDEINKFLKRNKHLAPLEFVEHVLDEMQFNYLVSDKYLENIPTEGRVVIIANHPLGALDALALIKLISSVRKDVKIIANDFLNTLTPLRPILLDINNFKNKQSKESINNIYDALNSEEVVIIFPSGEVSRATPTGIKDKKWHKGFLKFAKRSNSPILPVFIGGKNSKIFYSVSALNKKLSMLLLSNEMFKQKNKSIEIIVGELIPYENVTPKGIEQEQLIRLYKKHLYNLKKGISFFTTQKAIALPEDRRNLKKELKKSPLLGLTKDNKKIYLYEYSLKNSAVLNELGRLREISFRKVGEGANKKRDIDKYDRYYKHIILWDNEALEIVGAYRIAECKNILEHYSQNALYTTTLFEYNDALVPYLKNSIELGRSFVQPKYWGSRALDYLWQGIGAYIKSNPQIEYMYGPVSISGAYPKIAKNMILYFYDYYFHDNEALVQAKLPYTINLEDEYMKSFIKEIQGNNYNEDFKLLKKALGFLELSVPTLYKQYADLCEKGGIRFSAYNIDEDFSDCVDSFILVDVKRIKEKQKKRYFGE
ncbi:lysophospholipid acyltransferase family protein [Sulfurimonas sp.]|uniref:lysophospholipid acyltransferase family protein n=1 Tax=Sulfurimonas sp. TaxID=2022749 RepID=UPI00262CB9E4|nr:lysophospholipid acyltransferase family protein [Sulfurimonas sp.]